MRNNKMHENMGMFLELVKTKQYILSLKSDIFEWYIFTSRKERRYLNQRLKDIENEIKKLTGDLEVI